MIRASIPSSTPPRRGNPRIPLAECDAERRAPTQRVNDARQTTSGRGI